MYNWVRNEGKVPEGGIVNSEKESSCFSLHEAVVCIAVWSKLLPIVQSFIYLDACSNEWYSSYLHCDYAN